MPKLYKYAAIAVAASLIISSLAVSLIIPALAVQASAKQASSTVSGEYANSDWGSQITFPQGWMGMADVTSKSKEGFSVTVKNNATNPVATIIMEGWEKKLGKAESAGDWLHRHTPHEFNCVIAENNPTTYNSYGVTKDLNGMKVVEIVQECTLPGVAGIKTKIYGVETTDKAVLVSFSASSGLPTAQYFWPGKYPNSQPNNYEKYLEMFESSAKTFKVSWAPATEMQP
jgi:hypothetical protein